VVGRDGGSGANHEGGHFDVDAAGLLGNRKPKSQPDLSLAGQRKTGMDACAAGTQVVNQNVPPAFASPALQPGRQPDDRSWM
jgi:hypothetical protein